MADLLIRPFPVVTDPFGSWEQWRQDMGLGRHRGADFDCDEGDPIRASGLGVCTAEGWDDYVGWWVVIRYATAFGEIYIGYCHMQARTHLRYGDWVDAANGDNVGFVGNTGSATTGAHLHMTASWTNGNPAYVPVIDPMQFFSSSSAPAGGGSVPIPNTSGRNDMSSLIARVEADGSCHVWNLETGATQHIPDTYQLGVLQRFLPTTSFAEHNQFAEFRKWYGKTLSTADAPAQVVIDYPKVAKEVSDKVIAAVQASGVKVDLSGIPAAVDSVLADNFATIAPKVADELKSRL